MKILAKFKNDLLLNIRKTLRIKPKNTEEELRRLNWLRKLPRAKPGKVKWQGEELHYADAEAFYSQLNEVFVQKQYDFASHKKSQSLIDCGAHVGLVSMRWRQLFADASIIAVEADPTIGDLLKKNVEFKKIQVIHKAAWTNEQGIKFRSTGVDNGNVDLSGKQGKKIPSFPLAEIINGPIEFLKMDVEGCEYILLRDLVEKEKFKTFIG